MMIRLLILLFLLAMPSQSPAACIGSSPHWTTDGNEAADVQECINGATAGDTITVVAGDGTATWDSTHQIVIDRKVHIVGPGSSLRVTWTGSFMTALMVDGWSVSNFSFYYPNLSAGDNDIGIKSNSCTGWRVHHNVWESAAVSDSFVAMAADVVASSRSNSGLFDHNSLQDGKIWVGSGGGGTALWSLMRYEPLNLGDDENVIYVEDNEFIFTDLHAGNSIDSGRGSRWVFRYNKVVNSFVMAHGFQDGGRGSRQWEVYGNEFTSPGSTWLSAISFRAGTGTIFGNTFSGYPENIRFYNDRSYYTDGTIGYYYYGENELCDANADICGLCDGNHSADGNGVEDSGTHGGSDNSVSLTDGTKVWSTDYWKRCTITNTTTGASGQITANTATTLTATLAGGSPDNLWDMSNGYSISCGWPCRDQIGRSRDAAQWTDYLTNHAGPTQEAQPAYIWMVGSTKVTVPTTNLNDIILKTNRDFFDYNPANTTGSIGTIGDKTTGGVGCGSALPATCTAGAAFWVTAQSCSDLTGRVGPDRAVPLSGTLSVCIAPDTWSNYYTPYEYPHPLQSEVETDTTPPIISSVSPTGAQSCTSNPRSVTRSWSTNEAATCTIGGVAPDTTGGTSHSHTASQACGASYTPEIVCTDEAENASEATAMSYSISNRYVPWRIATP